MAGAASHCNLTAAVGAALHVLCMHATIIALERCVSRGVAVQAAGMKENRCSRFESCSCCRIIGCRSGSHCRTNKMILNPASDFIRKLISSPNQAQNKCDSETEHLCRAILFPFHTGFFIHRGFDSSRLHKRISRPLQSVIPECFYRQFDLAHHRRDRNSTSDQDIRGDAFGRNFASLCSRPHSLR